MKILIVDDSVVFRSSIKMALGEVIGFEVYKAVSNGKLAVDEVRANPDIDMITLDMEMPIMDGMETVQEIRKFNKKVKIIIFASQTAYGAERTIKVLNLGANDFVAKIEGSGTIEDSVAMITENLVPKMKALVGSQRHSSAHSIAETPDYSNLSNRSKAPSVVAQAGNPVVKKEFFTDVNSIIANIKVLPDLILFTSSTGGPAALTDFFNSVDCEIPVPMMLVQHMPPIFTTKLADALSKLSPVEVVEAQDGHRLKKGVCYLAPGDFHMTLGKDLSISLNQDEKVCYVRPSADVLFDSVASNFSGRILTIVFTGMGSDGTNGCKKLLARECDVVVQDESTSVVWGMPGSVVRAGLCPDILPLGDMSDLLNKIAKL